MTATECRWLYNVVQCLYGLLALSILSIRREAGAPASALSIQDTASVIKLASFS
jgi:hypothetical protein